MAKYKGRAYPTIPGSGNSIQRHSASTSSLSIRKVPKRRLSLSAEQDRWARLTLRIYTEVAIAFAVTVKVLEDKKMFAETDGHFAVCLLLTEFFHVSENLISQYLKISMFQLASALEYAHKRRQQDTDFRDRYDGAREKLSSIGRDTLPSFIDPTVLPPIEKIPDDGCEPCMRFERTAAQPKRGTMRTPRQVDIAS